MDIISRLVKYNKEKKEIMSNDDYIIWLENFTLSKGFSDDEYLYQPDEISETDKKNVDKLHLLYEIINEYAEKNYIYPSQSENYYIYYYFIKNNNIIYEIGCITGQGTTFYCNRVKANETLINNLINFEDIKNNKKNRNTLFIEEKLDLLSKYIYSINETVPIEAIESLMQNTIDEIKTKKQEKELVKVLKK